MKLARYILSALLTCMFFVKEIQQVRCFPYDKESCESAKEGDWDGEGSEEGADDESDYLYCAAVNGQLNSYRGSLYLNSVQFQSSLLNPFFEIALPPPETV